MIRESTQEQTPPRTIAWQRPKATSVVLNVDGSALTNPGKAGFGGLVRNSDGEFVFGFYGSAGL